MAYLLNQPPAPGSYPPYPYPSSQTVSVPVSVPVSVWHGHHLTPEGHSVESSSQQEGMCITLTNLAMVMVLSYGVLDLECCVFQGRNTLSKLLIPKRRASG